MKTAVIFADGVKQIMFTPENDSEKFALSLITSDDNIELLLKTGDFYDNNNSGNSVFSANLSKCRGGYLRIYEDHGESRILVLSPKDKK